MTAPEFGQEWHARNPGAHSDVTIISVPESDATTVQIVDLEAGRHRPWITIDTLHANYTQEQP